MKVSLTPDTSEVEMHAVLSKLSFIEGSGKGVREEPTGPRRLLACAAHVFVLTEVGVVMSKGKPGCWADEMMAFLLMVAQ